MQVQIRNGYESPVAAWNPDIRIIIDVFRASTTAIAILEKAPSQYLISNDLIQIQALIGQSYRLVSEVYDLGIDNSPTLVRERIIKGDKVVHKSTNLTTALEENYFESQVVVGCFNNVDAVVKHVVQRHFSNIEIVPAGQMGQKCTTPEDTLCAETMKAHILGQSLGQLSSPQSLLGNWEEKKKTRGWPEHFIGDIELAIQLNTSSIVPIARKISSGIFEVQRSLLAESGK